MGYRPRVDVDGDAIRVHIVLREQPGLSLGQIAEGLHAKGYVADVRSVVAAIERNPQAFRSDGAPGELRWWAVGGAFPGLAAQVARALPARRGPAYDLGDAPWFDYESDIATDASWSLDPREASADDSSDDAWLYRDPDPEDVLAKIKGARASRGDPELDTREAEQVLANLRRRSADPRRYRKWCWNCRAVVDEATNEHCYSCNWLVCWCGACRDWSKLDRDGLKGPCRRSAWLLASDTLPDEDFRGQAILTAAPPSRDAAEIQRVLSKVGLTAVYHWSPLRAAKSILHLGILAREGLDARRIGYVRHNLGDTAKTKALARYVSISLRPKTGMMADWSETPVVWQLHPDVLTTSDALFLPDNAASRRLNLHTILESTGPTALRAALAAYQEPGRQHEILIPGRVPRAAIMRVHVADPAVVDAVTRAQNAARAPLPQGIKVTAFT